MLEHSGGEFFLKFCGWNSSEANSRGHLRDARY